MFSPSYFTPTFRWQALKWHLDMGKHTFTYLSLHSSSFCLQDSRGELKFFPVLPKEVLQVHTLQDTSNNEQVKAEIMCTTCGSGSCRCDLLSAQIWVKAVLHGVFTIVRQGKTEQLEHNMEPFLNSDSMPLSSHTQLTTLCTSCPCIAFTQMWNRAKYSRFKYCIITNSSLYCWSAYKMDTEQMSGSTFAFLAALTWVTDSTTGATK